MHNVLAPSGLPTPPSSPLSFDYPKCAQPNLFQQQQQQQQPQSIRTQQQQQQRYVPVAPADRIGTYLGNLQLTGIIGTGAYGVVYEAVDVKTRARYAVKALSKLNADGTPLEARQIDYQTREIRLHYEASAHPNVVSMHRIIDVYPDCLFVVLEYCAEGDLFYNITECGHFVGKDELARKVFCQILDAVHFLHSKGIYHRDLKPENILVADRGETLKLADFGLATASERSEDYGCGSTFYMSPECLGQNSKRPYYYCAPNDVWSLGVILVNLTCGRNPWKQASTDDSTYRAYARNPRFLKTILPLSDELDDILARIFAINPDQRITLPELKQRILACPRFTVSPQEQAAAAAAAAAAAQQQQQQIQIPVNVFTPPTTTPQHNFNGYEASCASDYAIVDDDEEDAAYAEDDEYDEVASEEDDSVFDKADRPLTPASSVDEIDEIFEDVDTMDSVSTAVVEVEVEEVGVQDCPSPAVSDDCVSLGDVSLVADDEDSELYECQDLPEIVTPPPPSVAVRPPPFSQQVVFQASSPAAAAVPPPFQPIQQCLPPTPVFFEAEDAAMLGVDAVSTPAAFQHHQQHQQFLQQQHAPIYHFQASPPSPPAAATPTPTPAAAAPVSMSPAAQQQLPLPPPPPQQAPMSQQQLHQQQQAAALGSKFFFPSIWDWVLSKNAAVQGHVVQPLLQQQLHHPNHPHYSSHHQQHQQHQQQWAAAMHHSHHLAGFHNPMPMFNMQGCY
ncbi:RAN protein kinase [Sporothrix schenckii ATCC 58251]|uniref:Autophagy-related protein 1 n=1 Tax=Sporothrix schenckii (strain ATCC 58251 / de Perez 2211183) TaxID=1391915 RepID=U7PQK6_SPOS1|nr:RAN protein kinase [Sporothrix schenckii ATCC 58251]